MMYSLKTKYLWDEDISFQLYDVTVQGASLGGGPIDFTGSRSLYTNVTYQKGSPALILTPWNTPIK